MKQVLAGRTSLGGFTLLESAISLAVFALLIVSVASIAVETSSLLGDSEADLSIQLEGNQAFSRLAEILRKSGPVEEAEVSYPRVLDGGAELEFRMPQDLDGNGYPFDQASGETEWSPDVFSVRVASGRIGIYNGTTEVYPLARNLSFVGFETVAENPGLRPREIGIALEARTARRAGNDAVYTVIGSVHMRN